MDPYKSATPYSEVRLDRLRYLRPFMVGAYVWQSAKARLDETILGDMLVTWEHEVLAGLVVADTRTFTVQHPASWWQHLKLLFPAWYQKRWPAQWSATKIEVDFKRYETFPKASIQLPPSEFGYPVIVDQPGVPLIESAWKVDDSGPGETQYATTSEICYAIARNVIPPDYSFLYRVDQVLDGLAKLGVNPDQLVLKAAVDGRRW